VIGVEPAGADDAARSLRAGRIVPRENPETIADGLRATIGERPFAEIRRLVEEIITVTDPAIVRAMRQMWEVLKIVVEPSAAVPYAALLDAPPALRGRRIGIIVSGGNLDLDHLPWSTAASA
jgi:threonine dehydratase